MSPAVEDIVLFAPMGSNPASLVSFAWALERRRGLRVVDAVVVVVQKGHAYIERELLPPRGGLDRLHEVLGEETLPRARLRVERARLPDGRYVEDELTDDHAGAYRDAVLTAAVRATDLAGERRLVFGLLAGRRRAMTVMAALVAQYVARPRDMVLDLRVEPRGADIPGEFFFPEQRDQVAVRVAGVTLRPRDVGVDVVDVEVPRLRALLPRSVPRRFAELLALGQRAIDRAAPVQLEVRLGERTRGAWAHDPETGERFALGLSDAELLYVASLCVAHERSPGLRWVPVARAADVDHPFAELARRLPWAKEVRGLAVKWFTVPEESAEEVAMPDEVDAAHRVLRARTRTRIRKAIAGRDDRHRALVPEPRRHGDKGWERLPVSERVLHWSDD